MVRESRGLLWSPGDVFLSAMHIPLRRDSFNQWIIQTSSDMPGTDDVGRSANITFSVQQKGGQTEACPPNKKLSKILRLQCGDALAHFFDIGAAIEGADAEESFSGAAEAAAGGDDDIGFIQHFVEHLPARHSCWATDPNVWGVDTTEDGESGFGAGFDEEFGIAHVMFDQGGDLGFACLAVNGFGTALDDVADAVELGAVATAPEGVDSQGCAVFLFAHEGLWDDDDGATDAGESAVLGEAAELNGAVAGTFDFEDAAGDGWVLDEGLVGGIIKDDGAVGFGVGDPGFKLRAGGGGSGRVVWVAEIDEVHRLTRDLRDETVFRGALHIVQARVGTGFIGIARIASHDVGVHIDRVNGVSDGDFVAVSEDVQDVACIALAAIRDEDFIRVHIQATGLVVVVSDGITQEVVALFRTVATEAGAVAHFIHRLVHGFTGGVRQSLGHIANATADQALRCVGVGLGEGFHTTCDFWEEISGFELEVVFVEVGHGDEKGAMKKG